MKFFKNMSSIEIKEKIFSEEDLANIMFKKLIEPRLDEEEENKTFLKQILIDGFKQRCSSVGFDLNNGTDIEQLSLLYQEQKGHISLTEIDLIKVDQGFDIITFNEILHLSEVKSSLRNSGVSRDIIIDKYIESIKSQLCNKRKITNQLLDTMKIVKASNLTIDQINSIRKVLLNISEINISSTKEITSLHNDGEIELQSFIITSSAIEEFEFLSNKKSIKDLVSEKLKKRDTGNVCLFCGSEKCTTVTQLEELKHNYKVYVYRINDVFSTKKYLEKLIEKIEVY